MLKDLNHSFDLLDIFETKHLNEIFFTFHQPNISASRIDRAYCSRQLIQNIIRITHLSTVSDHRAIFLHYKDGHQAMDSRTDQEKPWRMNPMFLKDPDFMKSFKIFYDNILKQRNKYSTMAVWWDTEFKSGFKIFRENFKRNKNKAKSNIRSLILHKLNSAINAKSWDSIKYWKKKLLSLNEETIEVLKLKSGVNLLENEQLSLFHVMRVKRSNYDPIEGIKIIDEHGNSKLIRDPIKIENEVVNFYEHLFNGMNDKDLNQTDEPFTQGKKDESFFLDALGKMDNEDHAELEQDVSVDKIEE